MKKTEVDLDTLKKLKNLKLRPDESLSSVIGRLAVYSFDWEPLTEEFIRKLEKLEQERDNFIPLDEIDTYSPCDEDVEKEEIAVYEWYPPEFIEEIDNLMAQKPIDLPAGMSLHEYLSSLPEADDKRVIELSGNTAKLLERLGSSDESLDSIVKRIADCGIGGEEILSYGSIREIQRLLREGKSVGPFNAVEEFNEHLKYLPKEKILV